MIKTMEQNQMHNQNALTPMYSNAGQKNNKVKNFKQLQHAVESCDEDNKVYVVFFINWQFKHLKCL